LFADGKEYIAHPDSLQVSEKMFQERKHCDVIIDVKGEKMSVHRAVLAANSPVFDAMFAHDMKENRERMVKITDIDAVCIQRDAQIHVLQESREHEECGTRFDRCSR